LKNKDERIEGKRDDGDELGGNHSSFNPYRERERRAEPLRWVYSSNPYIERKTS